MWYRGHRPVGCEPLVRWGALRVFVDRPAGVLVRVCPSLGSASVGDCRPFGDTESKASIRDRRPSGSHLLSLQSSWLNQSLRDPESSPTRSNHFSFQLDRKVAHRGTFCGIMNTAHLFLLCHKPSDLEVPCPPTSSTTPGYTRSERILAPVTRPCAASPLGFSLSSLCSLFPPLNSRAPVCATSLARQFILLSTIFGDFQPIIFARVPLLPPLNTKKRFAQYMGSGHADRLR